MELTVSNGVMAVGATILYPRGSKMIRAKVREITVTTRLGDANKGVTSYKINVLPEGFPSWDHHHTLRNPRTIVLLEGE